TGGLRGAGDTRWPLLITFLGLCCIRLPLAAFLAWPEVPLGPFVLPGLGWGVQGAWIAMVSDIVVRAVLVVLRFLHGGWRQIAVWCGEKRTCGNQATTAAYRPGKVTFA